MTDTADTTTLLHLEQLKQLKARYCRFLDTKEWTAWRALFRDDFVSDTSAAAGPVITGADEFVDFVRRSIGDRATAHQVHAPDLEITSAGSARGYWAPRAVVHLGPGLHLQGFGYYEESYTRDDGSWLIASSTLTRLRTDIRTPLGTVYLGRRLERLLLRAGARSTS